MRSDIHRFESWKRDIYPRYWMRKSREYGFDSYCKGLLDLVEECRPGSVFELAIGTGHPFAENLLTAGINVAGCDISKELIDQLRKDFPSISACVGGYEDLNDVKNEVSGKFDLVYSFRSTWYFTDIAAAIDFMLYFARPGGKIIFDIMNKDCEWNKVMVTRKKYIFPLTLVKNIIKFVANLIAPGRYMIDTLFGVREIMYSPSQIETILKDRGLAYETITLAQIEVSKGGASFSPDQKLVYIKS